MGTITATAGTATIGAILGDFGTDTIHAMLSLIVSQTAS
jgi:hypothetical protein